MSQIEPKKCISYTAEDFCQKGAGTKMHKCLAGESIYLDSYIFYIVKENKKFWNNLDLHVTVIVNRMFLYFSYT